jgi:hypothetical protein
MFGAPRKVVVYSSRDGLILHSAGGFDERESLLIDFESKSVASTDQVGSKTFRQKPYLECHGILGMYARLPEKFLISSRPIDTTMAPIERLG